MYCVDDPPFVRFGFLSIRLRRVRFSSHLLRRGAELKDNYDCAFFMYEALYEAGAEVGTIRLSCL
jgi:hypothetical protein